MAGRYEQRRVSFGSVADLYDEARPTYPAALVDRVIEYSGCRPGDEALEVGAGTGKATRLFAGRGLVVTALEPSREMAAVASRRAATAELHVRIHLTDFESAELPEHAFALVYSAQAWHWIAPERRYALAHRALKGRGALAAFWNRPDWRRCELRGAIQDAYGRSGVELHDNGPMYAGAPTPLDLGDEWNDQLVSVGGFTDVRAERFDWEQDYTAQEYIDLLRTHSDHIVLEPSDQERLMGEVAAAIERHGGVLRLPYATVLGLARSDGA